MPGQQHDPASTRRRALVLGAVLLALLALAGCSSASGSSEKAAGPVALRLGYFPNVTHATALAGVSRGIFRRDLGTGVQLRTTTFNAGPAAVEALFSGALDASYVGPNPAINAYVKSHGQAVRIISGATSGGAALVVSKRITSVAQLRGTKIATPQLGNTQDVALRYWLRQQHLRTSSAGGGDVSVVPQDNAQTLQTFKAGQIDGAWVPEPWASRLVVEAGAHVLTDERSLWPGGRFATTLLIVRTQFMRQHPDAVRRLLQGQVDATSWVNAHPAQAQATVNAAIKGITGKSLKPAVLAAAWKNMTFTNDPIAPSLRASAQHAEAVGLLKKADLGGIFDLRTLNQVLTSSHQAAVSAT